MFERLIDSAVLSTLAALYHITLVLLRFRKGSRTAA
jgi:hypothetical protein